MLDKPDIANYPMDTRERILTKTIIEYINKNHLQPTVCKVVDIEEVFPDED